MSLPYESAIAWYQTSHLPMMSTWVCETRDIFQARLGTLLKKLISEKLPEPDAYMFSALAGEVGNNSFDHNLGQWQDIPGCWFEYRISPSELNMVIADRGQGILTSLKRVLPELQDDATALKTAFYERISGRKPEKRGNGLKFVRSILDQSENKTLVFTSGTAILSFGGLKTEIPAHITSARGKGVMCYICGNF